MNLVEIGILRVNLFYIVYVSIGYALFKCSFCVGDNMFSLAFPSFFFVYACVGNFLRFVFLLGV